ncbi:MAG: SCP2 sterol-binding domain-containing protein [Candidatus Thorarchaeota archaeon]
MTQDLLELMRERIAVGLSEPETVKHLDEWDRTALLMLKDGRHYHFIVKDKNITVHEGTIEEPDMKIQSDEETIRKLFLEEMRAEVALIKRKLKVKGSTRDLMKIRHIF